MKEDTMFKMKRSASAEVRRKFQELNEQIPLAVNEVMEAVIFFFVDEDVNNSWMYFINRLKEQHRDYLTPEERREFLLDLSAQSMKKFTYELDPVSRLLMMGASNTRDMINWHMRFPDALVSNFRLEGTYGCIDGRPRFGKTATAINLMKLMHERFGFTMLTNIVIDEEIDWIINVTRLSDLVLKMSQEKEWVAVLDETGTFVGKKRALSKENVDFENLTRYIGKMGGRLILITHSFELDIPTILQTWITEKYTKYKLDQMKVILSREGGFMKLNKLITGVPDAELKFRSDDITSLNFDISVKMLLDRIQDNITIEDAIAEQLKEERNVREGLDHKQVKAMVDDACNNDATKSEAFRSVGEALGRSKNYIRDLYYS